MYSIEVHKRYPDFLLESKSRWLFCLLAALSIVGTMLTRNIKMPVFLSHTMYEIGTGWLIFTLYMVLFLLAFDLLKLCRIPFNYSFVVSLLFTVILLGYGYYNYRHPKTNIVNIALNKPLTGDRQPIKIAAVSDLHLGYGTGKTGFKAIREDD